MVLLVTVQKLLPDKKTPASKALLLQLFPVIVVALQPTIIIPDEESKPVEIAGADTPLLLEVLLVKLQVLLLRAIIPWKPLPVTILFWTDKFWLAFAKIPFSRLSVSVHPSIDEPIQERSVIPLPPGSTEGVPGVPFCVSTQFVKLRFWAPFPKIP